MPPQQPYGPPQPYGQPQPYGPPPGYPQQYPPPPPQQYPPAHQDKTKMLAPKVWRVRVIMDAADPGFVQRHPEIGGLHGKYGATTPGSYGLPLGPVNNMVGQIAQALATYAGPLFGGVIEEGQVLGFHYL